MTLLDGKKTSQDIQAELAIEVAKRKEAGKKIPHLAAVIVGNNGASLTYVNAKVKSTIICPIHGEFQQNPDKHLSGKYGCLKCSNLQRKITLSKLPKQKRKVRSDWVVEKAYLDPLRNVLGVVGWHHEKQASLESFFV